MAVQDRRLTGTTTRTTVAALLFAAFGASLAQTVVVAALPSFQRELNSSTTNTAWVLTAFMLASAISVPLAGRLGDMRGYRRVMVGCLGVFAVGALVAALGTHAGSLDLVIVGRVLQGVSGGVFPLAMGIVRIAVRPDLIPRIVAVLSAMFGVGGAAGMVITGPLVDHFGTESLSWLILILALGALLGTRLLPGTAGFDDGRVDWRGAVVLSAAVVCLLLGISEGNTWGWTDPKLIALLVAAVALLAAFTIVELRAADPLINLRLLTVRAFATANAVAFVIGAAMFGSITLIPRFVESPQANGYGFSLSASGAGLVMIPVAVFTLIGSFASSRITARFGSRIALCVGCGCAAIAFAWLAWSSTDLWTFYVTGALVGTGYGLAFAAVGNMVVGAVAPEHTGVAVGVNTIVRTIGGAIGAQIASAVLTASAPTPRALPAAEGYTHGFVLFSVVALAALATTLAMPRATTSRSRVTEPV